MQYVKSIIFSTLIVAIGILVVLSTGNMALAQVAGQCSNCHTMHNSQNGTGMGGGPSDFLVRTSNANVCVGCHTSGGVDAAPKIDIAATMTGNYVTGMSAGGTVQDGVDAHIHNILDINSKDQAINNGAEGCTPPGWADGKGGHSIGANWGTNQLRCAGTYGCHGNNAEGDQNLAVRGAHHTDDTTIDGLSVGKSYRFLDTILGQEATATTATFGGKTGYVWSDNKYSADDAPAATDTISYLCAECHGNFHHATVAGGVGGGASGNTSPFQRHPSDITIDSTRLGIPGATVLPVGYTDYASGAYTEANRKGLLCISCHLSHGSIQDDLLRFSYSAMLAGQATPVTDGCLACHTRQQ
jgi:predicted CXXCH cytochrome family protein